MEGWGAQNIRLPGKIDVGFVRAYDIVSRGQRISVF